ncbi:MAG: hypothetical protein Fur006_65900 [Coleofasciculaceae cyanobacterium]
MANAVKVLNCPEHQRIKICLFFYSRVLLLDRVAATQLILSVGLGYAFGSFVASEIGSRGKVPNLGGFPYLF